MAQSRKPKQPKKQQRKKKQQAVVTAPEVIKKKPAGGRPTKYKPEYCTAIIKWFEREAFRISKIIITGKNDYKKEEEKLLPERLPTLERFAHEVCDTDVQTLEDWCKVHSSFLQAYKRAKGLQKTILFEGGAAGVYNSNVVALIASHEHKIQLAQAHTFQNPDGSALAVTVSFVAAISGRQDEKQLLPQPAPLALTGEKK